MGASVIGFVPGGDIAKGIAKGTTKATTKGATKIASEDVQEIGKVAKASTAAAADTASTAQKAVKGVHTTPRGPPGVGATVDSARSARDAAGRLSDGRPDRSSAAYVGIIRDGEVAVGRAGPGIHAEVAADAKPPGATMTEVMGWRRNFTNGQLEWTQIPICSSCQTRFPEDRFVPGTKRANGGGS